MESNKKKIFYWSPSLVNIATNKAVINSAYSMNKYSKEFECYIINFFGEFERYNNIIIEKQIKLINYFNKSIIDYLPKYGKIKSRLSFIIIFIMSFFPLINLIKKRNPEYLIIHLITSLPLFLLIFFNFKTKFILRISGFPRLGFFRKIFWKLALKKIHIVTCPTINTLRYIKKLNIVDSTKVTLLYDPAIIVKEISNKKNEKETTYKNYFLSVGRLTKQKNFLFLCKAFKKIINENKDFKLLIAGEGEDRKIINDFINDNDLKNKIILIGHQSNIFPFFKNAKGFILSSLWEDPGFVILEAAFCRTPVLCSDSWPGPVELIKDNFNGITFKNNNFDSFIEKFNIMQKHQNINLLKCNNLKNVKKFTIFRHYLSLSRMLIKNHNI